MNEKEKFIIDRNKLNEIVQEFQQKLVEVKGTTEEETLIRKYTNKIMHVLGNEDLQRAIDINVLFHYINNMLEGQKIHDWYNDEETLKMLEGLSNKQVVGDWQHFLTIKSDFIFELSQEQQEKIAENFAIGNGSAKECLIELWKNHIETNGTDVIRPEVQGSTNCITISTSIEKIPRYVEVLAKNLPNKDMFLLTQLDEKLKSGIISIHSSDRNLFDYISDSVQYLKEEMATKYQLKELPNSYWKNVQKYSSLHNVMPIQYLDISNIYEFNERTKEHKQVTQKSSRLSQQQINGIMTRIKEVPTNLFESVSAFMHRTKLEKDKDRVNEEEERDDIF